jgi:hypothetical protein
MSDREPVAQMLNSILTTVNEILVMANNPDTRNDVAAEEYRLGQILGRIELILTSFETSRPRPNRVRRVS